MDNRILFGAGAALGMGYLCYKFLNQKNNPMYSSTELFLGAIDVGTGSTRFLIFNSKGQKIASHSIELTQLFPSPEKHEQNPEEYLEATLKCIEFACEKARIPKSQIKGIGITNQRETTIA